MNAADKPAPRDELYSSDFYAGQAHALMIALGGAGVTATDAQILAPLAQVWATLAVAAAISERRPQIEQSDREAIAERLELERFKR